MVLAALSVNGLWLCNATSLLQFDDASSYSCSRLFLRRFPFFGMYVSSEELMRLVFKYISSVNSEDIRIGESLILRVHYPMSCNGNT